MTAKDLKNALLQEAVQGKLVPQIASEGNARDLLEEIRKEKLSHGLDFANAKSGKRKSKKETALAGSNPCDITEEEIPFDIPESWCWCRITDIATCELGKTKDAQKNRGQLKDYLCSINIQENGIDLSKIKQMKFEKDEVERYSVRKDDLLICEGGDAGRCAIFDLDTPMFYQNALHRVRFFNNINPIFYLYIFQLYKANNVLMEASKGVTIQHLTGESLRHLCFPLPPLAEQKRIVAAIEKFMPLIEEYGKKESALKEINEQIGALTKKAILQEAVQGKLVPQIAAEGNAKDLLEEIKKEKAKLIKEGKIKKEKTLPEISEEEIPFDIPETWCWCRLGDIVSILGDGIHGTPNYDISGNYYFVNGNNLNNGKIEIKPDTKKVNQSEYEKYKKELNKNTVFVSINGTLGNIAFYENEKIILGKSACYFNLIKNEMKKFIYWLIKTKYFLDYANQEATGTTIKNVSLAAMRNFPIPLPPLSEQKRIVDTIEKMLPLCEKLGV